MNFGKTLTPTPNSPSALLPTLSEEQLQRRYDLSAKTGFVPESTGRSAVRLNSSYAGWWEEAAGCLPDLANLGVIRAVVEIWPMLTVDTCAISTAEVRMRSLG